MRNIILQPDQRLRLLLMLGDVVIILGSLFLVILLAVSVKMFIPLDNSNFTIVSLVLSAITVFIYYILDLYEVSDPKSFVIILLSSCLGMVLVMTLYSSLSYLIIILRLGKFNLLICMLMIWLLTLIWHTSFNKLIKIKPHRILFIGKEKIIEDIIQYIKDNNSQYYEIVGHWHSHSCNPHLPNLNNFIRDTNADMIVYSVHSKILKQITNDLITVKFGQKNTIDAYNFYQHLTCKYPISFPDEFWLLVNAQKEIFFPTAAANLKRALDLLFVLLLLPVAVPLFLIAALAIKLDSKGPVLFIHERLGKNEVPFRLFKLRTMIDNAESFTGPQWALKDDPRITRVGRILRKLRIDEVPQLINVLKGEMSVIGPRPIRRHFAEILENETPYYRLRFLGKPGLTGWAQVNHDYAGTNEGHKEKLQYDLFYLMHQSLLMDIIILLKTIRVLVWAKGR
ncbi:MAG: exopolysaccharide biosynthesis polyprenyl glycosylphosphotransferase [Deltaproteobacteria bacterium]|nr:exopolysaccharide biosynthesis polyprenyl glycosylphosphotransferase [Deltaproteobacteria bacterium]